MGRPSRPVAHRLGQAIRERRGTRTLAEVAAELGVARVTVGRIESGSRRPSLDTARALAIWLGWTLVEVLDAAERPPEDDPTDAP